MKSGKRSIHVLMVAVMLGMALAVALPVAHAAHLTIDDTVEAQITLTHDAWWEFGVNSNETIFAAYQAGSTLNPGEVVTFTGTWYVNASGDPDPGEGIIYVVEPDDLNSVSDIINAQWSTQPGTPWGTATITIDVTSSSCYMGLGTLPAAFAGLGVVETGKLFGIVGLFRDPDTAAPVTIPSNLGIQFGSAICVDIDIKPGSDPNCFNNNGHGVIPVAILSDCGDGGFDATQVDPDTVSLSGLSVKVVGKNDKLLAHIEDVNGDGCDDLIVQIADQDNAFEEGEVEAILTGKLYDGTIINGVDSICIVP